MELFNRFLKFGEQEYTHKSLGLERIEGVLEVLSHPEQAYPCVLIAGTNGKGSVARMVESVMLKSEAKVGLYTSPHLHRFTERIRIQGKEITEESCERILKKFLEQGLMTEAGEMRTPSGEALTWFEKTTVLAFEAFRQAQVDLAILEVGLGARLDATNVTQPLVSAIASVGRDHTEVLGDSLFEIAREKSAVMRAGQPLILGNMEKPIRTFLMKAARMAGAHPVLPPLPQGSTESFSYGPFENLSLGMKGAYQLANAATALEILIALKRFGWSLENRQIRDGLKEARFPGRMEWISSQPEILLDCAHNELGWENLRRELEQNFSDRPLTLVFGILKSQSGRGVLELFERLGPQLILTEVSSPRGFPIEAWEKILASPHGYKNIQVSANPQDALKQARALTASDGLIVITGSIYLIGEMREML